MISIDLPLWLRLTTAVDLATFTFHRCLARVRATMLRLDMGNILITVIGFTAILPRLPANLRVSVTQD